MRDSLLLRSVVRWRATEFVQILYQSILGRDPDDQGRAVYGSQLRRSADLVAVATAIANSEEARRHAMYRNPEPLVEAAFHSLLGRAPDEDARVSYGAGLITNPDLCAMLTDIAQSDEHWRRLVGTHAGEVVRCAFIALLKREPDPESHGRYADELRCSRDLTAILNAIADSEELRDRLLHSERASRPEPSESVPAAAAYSTEAWVFIHAQKTAGTSLQKMLMESLGENRVYHEHADTLHRRSPADLAPYSAFAGHFNFDTVAYIPRRSRRLITLLREPRQRLLSQYRFLRAHEPSAPEFERGMERANRLNAPDFFSSIVPLDEPGLWNHLTWCVMGQRKWSEYAECFQSEGSEGLERRMGDIRYEMRQRIQEFAFIGLQGDFSRSCELLFELMGATLPPIRHEHSVESLWTSLPHFKYVARQASTGQLDTAMAPLIRLDDILYSESRQLYSRLCERVNNGGEGTPA